MLFPATSKSLLCKYDVDKDLRTPSRRPHGFVVLCTHNIYEGARLNIARVQYMHATCFTENIAGLSH
jgi:hypothetical protein